MLCHRYLPRFLWQSHYFSLEEAFFLQSIAGGLFVVDSVLVRLLVSIVLFFFLSWNSTWYIYSRYHIQTGPSFELILAERRGDEELCTLLSELDALPSRDLLDESDEVLRHKYRVAGWRVGSKTPLGSWGYWGKQIPNAINEDEIANVFLQRFSWTINLRASFASRFFQTSSNILATKGDM